MNADQIKHMLEVFGKECLSLSTRIGRGDEPIPKKDKDLVRIVFFNCIQDDVKTMETAYITNNSSVFFDAMENAKEVFEFLA